MRILGIKKPAWGGHLVIYFIGGLNFGALPMYDFANHNANLACAVFV